MMLVQREPRRMLKIAVECYLSSCNDLCIGGGYVVDRLARARGREDEQWGGRPVFRGFKTSGEY